MLHIIQNDPEVPPGNLLDSLALPYVITHAYEGGKLPEPGAISAIIVLGGSMGANDDHRYPFLAEIKKLIREVVSEGTPYLGICLGGQLLASALGGGVYSNRWGELGTLPVFLNDSGMDDPLFKDVEREFITFQWHHDSFDIPAEGVLLASSPACPNQAFRVGSSAWGVQFHPEVTEKIIKDWCAWDLSSQKTAEEIISDFRLFSGSYKAAASRIFGNFTGLLNL